MPNRDTRRHGTAPSLGKWVYIEDANGLPYEIFMRDISGKDEYDFFQMMGGTGVGLTDIFLEGKVTLVGIAGLIWSQRRKQEKKLAIVDVLRTVNMACIETMELHDPDDPDEAERDSSEPEHRLAELERERAREGLPGFGEPIGANGPGSVPATG